jgi:hypothetical protein
VQALRAAVKIRTASRAGALGTPGDCNGQFVAAAGASHHLPKTGHIERLRGNRRLSSRRILLLFGRLLIAPWLARVVLIAALTILSVGHR